MTSKDIKSVNELKARFPRVIEVAVKKYDDGFLADILTFAGVSTQGTSYSELIEMVNDAVRSYLEVPEGFLPFMPTYQPLLEQATILGVFPVRKETQIKLEIQDGAAVAC